MLRQEVTQEFVSGERGSGGDRVLRRCCIKIRRLSHQRHTRVRVLLGAGDPGSHREAKEPDDIRACMAYAAEMTRERIIVSGRGVA